MRYEILGPLQVVNEEGESYLTAPKIEVVLAMLLIRVDHIVSTEQLHREIWDDNPPRRAAASLHVYVSQLRKFLRRPGEPASPIVTRPAGYLLELRDDELDLVAFLDGVRRGQEYLRAGRCEYAVRATRAALDLWRGPVLNDLPCGPVMTGFATWINEEQLHCVELLTDAQLATGRHRELVGRLYALIVEHPLREAFYRQLMLALYRSDRQADALRVFDTARGVLRRELGVDPCRSLRELRQAILTADDRLDRREVA
ncbi:AfsR/SARP family transcriptional regulator [Streptosporangium saharense]|uniref:AfsR/SARP family transcriptional regulator n=1 Tax=Streptosporangium saharense TaxID=1706840 RepID=UPI003695EFF3